MSAARKTKPKPKSKKKTTGPKPKPKSAGAQVLHVRMYDVGFGDCFLLRTPAGQTVLVDAGFHSQGKGAFSGNELAEQVLRDVKAFTGRARVDVVIATHRHADHIVSFNSKTWGDLEVGEVWLPWVEDLSKPAVVRLWKKQQAFAYGLARALASFSLKAEVREAVDFLLWNAGVDPKAPLAAWSNADAMTTLREGFKNPGAKRRYLPVTKALPETFTTPVLPGVTVHALGPPADPGLIAHLDPSKDDETYRALLMRAAEMPGEPPAEVRHPFGDRWLADGPPPLRHDELRRLDSLARNVDPLFAAKALDDMINSTSLVLVLEVGAARLLLPGDAEWGTWKRILASPEARALLKGTTFFKVGHHGSHNATSKTLVDEVLPRAIPAMISTQEGKGTYRNDIPLPELLDALDAKGLKVARSDRPDDAPAGFKAAEKWIDLEVPC